MKKGLLFLLLFISIGYSQLYAGFNSLEYAWNSKEGKIVKDDWVKTEVDKKITYYIEFTKINGGVYKHQFIFYEKKLVMSIATIYSTKIDKVTQANIIWDDPIKILGPGEKGTSSTTWLRKDLNTWAVAGKKQDLLWFSSAQIGDAFKKILIVMGREKLEFIY